MTARGMPMSAMTRWPASASAGGSTSGSFGAPSVTVVVACIAGPIGSDRSAESPLGRSMATTGRGRRVDVGDDRFRQARERRRQAGADERVDDQVRAEHVRAVQLPRRRVRDLDDVDAERLEHVEIRARIAGRLPRRGRAGRRSSRRRARAACARRRSRRRRCCRVRTGRRRASTTACRTPIRSRPRPGGRRSPSARSTAMPTSSIVRRSASRICCALRTRTTGGGYRLC